MSSVIQNKQLVVEYQYCFKKYAIGRISAIIYHCSSQALLTNHRPAICNLKILKANDIDD